MGVMSGGVRVPRHPARHPLRPLSGLTKTSWYHNRPSPDPALTEPSRRPKTNSRLPQAGPSAIYLGVAFCPCLFGIKRRAAPKPAGMDQMPHIVRLPAAHKI